MEIPGVIADLKKISRTIFFFIISPKNQQVFKTSLMIPKKKIIGLYTS